MQVRTFRNSNLVVETASRRYILIWDVIERRVSFVGDKTTDREYRQAMALLRNVR